MIKLNLDCVGDNGFKDFIYDLLTNFKVKDMLINPIGQSGNLNISFTFNDKDHNDYGSDINNEFNEFMCEEYDVSWKDFIVE